MYSAYKMMPLLVTCQERYFPQTSWSVYIIIKLLKFFCCQPVMKNLTLMLCLIICFACQLRTFNRHCELTLFAFLSAGFAPMANVQKASIELAESSPRKNRNQERHWKEKTEISIAIAIWRVYVIKEGLSCIGKI